ncbi:MAG: hypothetical protein AB1453_03680 [Chloroflexota bacterium]
MNPSYKSYPEILPILPQSWHYRTAEWISRLGSPPLLASFSIWIATHSQNPPNLVYPWAMITVFWMIILPASYLIYLRRTGQITDLDVFVRSQRIRPYTLSIFCSAAALVILLSSNAPRIFPIIAAGGLMNTIGLFLVNLKWKISAHAAAAAGLSFLAVLFAGAAALPALITIPLIAWSRVHLRRHTLAQTAAGSLWGAASFCLIYYLFR